MTHFSVVKFFQKIVKHKEDNSYICKFKKVGHGGCLGENNHFVID